MIPKATSMSIHNFNKIKSNSSLVPWDTALVVILIMSGEWPPRYLGLVCVVCNIYIVKSGDGRILFLNYENFM